MAGQIRGEVLREARRMVFQADSRRIVARLVSNKQCVSELQLYMAGVKRPDLAKICYRLEIDSFYIVPIEPPKTKEQLIEEIMDMLTKYSINARTVPKWCYQKIRHNGRLIQRMSREGATL